MAEAMSEWSDRILCNPVQRQKLRAAISTRSSQSIAAHSSPLSPFLYLEPSRGEALWERRRMEVGTGEGHAVPKGLIL